MSWVSNANIKTIMQSIRNKFTTSDLVVTNDDKSIGAEFNYGGQDGLLSVSPLGTGASTEAALHLCNGDDTKKTELTQGTLSYVQGSGDSETYNYLSLLGDGVATFGKNGGGNIQVGGVADPTSNQQVATKKYVDDLVLKYTTVKAYIPDNTTFYANKTARTELYAQLPSKNIFSVSAINANMAGDDYAIWTKILFTPAVYAVNKLMCLYATNITSSNVTTTTTGNYIEFGVIYM